MEKLYTIKEVREMFSVSQRTVFRWIESGKLQAIKVGGGRRISESALKAFIEQGSSKATA